MLSLLCLAVSLFSLLMIPCLWTRSSFSAFKHQRLTSKPLRQNEKQNDTLQNESCRHRELRRDLMPRHVAVILDGNRRWAKQRGFLTIKGHEAGAKRLVELAQLCFQWGIHTLSAFAFSTENWGRPKGEVNSLMFLFEKYLKSMMPYFQRERIRISIIGNLTKIPVSLLQIIREIEESTKCYSTKHLIIAIDYSGRYDISQACKSIVQKVKDGFFQMEDVDENMIEQELLTKCTEFPNPDLLIRTSGELRISNFYLWQLAYTEFFFSPVLWPDFHEAEFVEALISYQQRERRFGKSV